MKRLLLLSLVLSLFFIQTASAQDMHWASSYAKHVSSLDASAEELLSKNTVSRSDFIQIVDSIFNADRDAWYARWLLNPKGFPGNQNPITRAQAIDILIDASENQLLEAQSFSDIDKSSWYAKAITTAKENGWINGFKDGTIRPNSNISGPELLKILSKITETKTTNLTIENIVSNEVYVDSHPISYKGGKIPAGSTGVDFLKFTIHNPSPKSLVLQSIKVKRMGLGNSDDINGVSLWDGFYRLTSSRRISKEDQSVRFSFPTQKIELDKGESITLTLKANISRNASAISEHYFVIEPKDIILNTSTGETINATGNKIMGDPHEISSIPRGQLIISQGHTPNRVNIGQRSANLGELILEAEGREDLVLVSLTLENKGSLSDEDLANIKLVDASSKELLSGPIPSPRSGYVTFNFSHHPNGGLLLNRNDMLRVYILGDIVNGFSGATVRFELDEPSDVHAIGLTTGGFRTFSERTAPTSKEATVSKSTASVAKTRYLDKVGSNTNRVIIGELETIVRGRDAFVRSAVFDIAVNGSQTDTTKLTSSGVPKGMVFRNVSIIDPYGNTVAGSTDPILVGNSYKLIFNDDFFIPSSTGELSYYLLSDIKNAENGDRYTIQFNPASSEIDFDY